MDSASVPEEADHPLIAVSETLAEWTRGALALLDEARDVEILKLRLGLDDGEKRTLEKVGRNLSVTRASASGRCRERHS